MIPTHKTEQRESMHSGNKLEMGIASLCIANGVVAQRMR